MKNLPFYQETLNCKGENEVFDYLITTLKPSNTTWSYFVNWKKVFTNTKEIEVALNTLNYLIGKEDFDEAFRFLIRKDPTIAKVIPRLIVRDGNYTNHFHILISPHDTSLTYQSFDFSKKQPTDSDIASYLTFIERTGLKKLLTSRKVKNLVDYTIGVEAGLDSNGRKNRSGHVMETLVEKFIRDLCQRNNYRYLKEATAQTIKAQLNRQVPIDKTSRRYDFVIDNGKDLYIIETNFYQKGGSKLKATAAAYRQLAALLGANYPFIWITDGKGWKTAKNPLRETFNSNDYVFNLAMVEKGILDYLLK